MTSDTKSSQEIEREIERERAGLKSSIDDLQDRFSLDGITRQVGDQLREHGGDFGRSIATSARDNPIALALTGIGIAWLVFGNNRGGTASRAGYDKDYYSGDGRHRVADNAPRGPVPRGHYVAEQVHRAPTTSKSSARPADSQPAWARDWDDGELGHSGSASSRSGASWSDTASGAADAVKGKAEDAKEAIASGAQSVRDTSADMAGSVRDAAGNVWTSASQRAEALSRRVTEGTEHLSQEARDRIAAARTRAIEARDKAARRVSRGADQAADFYETHPLVVGALAFAVGAAVAGALPRSRMEDEYVGEYSDDLFDEAERIYTEEVEKAKKVVSAGVDEARTVAAELKSNVDDAAPGDKSAVEAAGDTAKSAADRIAGAAKSKADDENLGDITKDK
ncbi:MAG TPA: DUF3618 domain-containing protein [Roseovarius sp.]